MINLDGSLVSRIKELKLDFGSQPQPGLLIAIPNGNKDIDYAVEITTAEFTSLCPLNLSQPDYACLTIRYGPEDWCVELKSLKYYLVSFRQVPIFHEEVPSVILKDLVGLLSPREIEVVGDFTTRGGLDTTVRATYSRK